MLLNMRFGGCVSYPQTQATGCKMKAQVFDVESGAQVHDFDFVPNESIASIAPSDRQQLNDIDIAISHVFSTSPIFISLSHTHTHSLPLSLPLSLTPLVYALV